MYIMGMKGFNYYFSWFCRYFFVFLVVHLISSSLIAIWLKNIPFYVIFLPLILFDILIIIQNFFIQVFLSRAKIGVIVALLFYLLQFIISFIASNSKTLNVNAALSIVPHAALVLAFKTILYAESYQASINFTSVLNNYVIGYALISLVVNILVYTFLTWYFDQVIPNEWGTKKHPLFCFFNKK
jgi:ATP-binding cassette subfamily A (ABC1) protein 3